jgi:hypothetical protein
MILAISDILIWHPEIAEIFLEFNHVVSACRAVGPKLSGIKKVNI